MLLNCFDKFSRKHVCSLLDENSAIPGEVRYFVFTEGEPHEFRGRTALVRTCFSDKKFFVDKQKEIRDPFILHRNHCKKTILLSAAFYHQSSPNIALTHMSNIYAIAFFAVNSEVFSHFDNGSLT